MPAESLQEVVLHRARGFPGDRIYAVTHGKSEFHYGKPAWVRRRNFLVVAFSPKLAGLRCEYVKDGQEIRLLDGSQSIEYDLDSQEDRDRLAGELGRIAGPPQQTGPFQIVQVEGTSITDSESQTVSLFNVRSLRELEKIAGTTLHGRRFRGNIWFDFDEAWAELDWIGRTIKIGAANLRVTEPIARCVAINANPETGEQDVDLVRLIRESYGHVNFGVLADVESEGAIQVGDPIRLE